MEPEIETSSIEPNRIRKEFEKRAKENEMNGKILIPSKTTRLIEKFEKKAQGVDDKRNVTNANSMVNNMKKVFEPYIPNLNAEDEDTPDRVIPPGSTNKLIGVFQQQPSDEQQQPAT